MTVAKAKAGIPPYFTSLKPFTGLFATGMPSLMYHKLGPRPRAVRLKGLYVSRSLFERQLSELHEAGFTTPAYGAAAGARREFRAGESR